MKPNRKYYFSVEGETEQWYLQWLQKLINNSAATHTVSLDCPIQKNPLKRAKSIIVRGKTVITHVCDYESNDTVHTEQFQKTLSAMKKSEQLGKQIKYKLGYSNFSFELWMVLHKIDCNSSIAHRRNYLTCINRAFEEEFENLDHFKKKRNFERVLRKIKLTDVKDAVARSKTISKKNIENNHDFIQYKGYEYCKNNPSLAIWETIEEILNDCEI